MLNLRAGFKGGGRGPGPQAPTNRGLPTEPFIFYFWFNRPSDSCVYPTHAALTSRIIFFSYFTAGSTITVEYFTLIVILKYYAEYLYNQWRRQTIKSGSAFKGQLYFQVGQMEGPTVPSDSWEAQSNEGGRF